MSFDNAIAANPALAGEYEVTLARRRLWEKTDVPRARFEGENENRQPAVVLGDKMRVLKRPPSSEYEVTMMAGVWVLRFHDESMLERAVWKAGSTVGLTDTPPSGFSRCDVRTTQKSEELYHSAICTFRPFLAGVIMTVEPSGGIGLEMAEAAKARLSPAHSVMVTSKASRYLGDVATRVEFVLSYSLGNNRTDGACMGVSLLAQEARNDGQYYSPSRSNLGPSGEHGESSGQNDKRGGSSLVNEGMHGILCVGFIEGPFPSLIEGSVLLRAPRTELSAADTKMARAGSQQQVK